MDYLDPRKKKQKKIRLMITYALLGIAISIATVLFVYLARGYFPDPVTGEIIQNGLMFIDSKPVSSTVYLNGQEHGQTDIRVVVPEGQYDIELRREGYENWNRRVQLEGGKLRRLTYGRLFPAELISEPLTSFEVMPSDVSQSIDKRWLVAAFDATPLEFQVVDLRNLAAASVTLTVPEGTITPTEDGTWELLEWSSDNQAVLAAYRVKETAEYVLINRQNPQATVNLNTIFSQPATVDMHLFARRRSEVIVYNSASDVLSRGVIADAVITPYVDDVLDFEAFDTDVVLYARQSEPNTDMVEIWLRRGDEQLLLREIIASDENFLEVAKLGDGLVVGIGSPAEGRAFVYNDPFNAVKQNDFSEIPVATTVLSVDQPEELTISADASTILLRGNRSFASHEFERDKSYEFTLDAVFGDPRKVFWMDGQHFIIETVDGAQIVSDFDGSNVNTLSPVAAGLSSVFNDQIDEQYTFVNPAAAGEPARLIRTFLRAEADR